METGVFYMEAFNLGVKSAFTKLLKVSDEFFLAEDKAEQKGNFQIKFTKKAGLHYIKIILIFYNALEITFL